MKGNFIKIKKSIGMDTFSLKVKCVISTMLAESEKKCSPSADNH